LYFMVYNIQHKRWSNFLVVSTNKVGRNFVGETEKQERVTTGAFVP
jgi:hypothetical protein